LGHCRLRQEQVVVLVVLVVQRHPTLSIQAHQVPLAPQMTTSQGHQQITAVVVAVVECITLGLVLARSPLVEVVVQLVAVAVDVAGITLLAPLLLFFLAHLVVLAGQILVVAVAVAGPRRVQSLLATKAQAQVVLEGLALLSFDSLTHSSRCNHGSLRRTRRTEHGYSCRGHF
jgi:hypothetical protein